MPCFFAEDDSAVKIQGYCIYDKNLLEQAARFVPEMVVTSEISYVQ